MRPKHRKLLTALLLISAAIIVSASGIAGGNGKPAPLIIQEQGSFAVGGTVIRNPGTFDSVKQTSDGQTLHGDHARVFYQVPVNARKLPLVFWHGFGQFSKTWETTPDGREGFQNIFLRRRFAVYVIDQPRRGGAGRSTVAGDDRAAPDEQRWFNTFRLGIWPTSSPGVQFSRDPEALNQYFRQMTPDTGPFDAEVASDAVSALFDKIGPGILVTHSHSGGLGLASRDQEQKRPRDRLLRAGQRLHLSGRRSAAVNGKLRGPAGRRLACLCRSSCCLQRFRSSSSTATTFRRSRSPTPGRTTGAYAWRWRGYGGMP